MALGHSPTIRAHRATGPGTPTRLSLTSGFQLVIDDRSVAVPHGVQRLLAFLAIARRPIARSRVAGQLWLDATEGRALANLRSALWRLHRLPRRVVSSLDERLAIAPEVDVDIMELSALSDEILDFADRASLERLPQLVAASEILPGWEDEWLILDRERFREMRLLALERGCEALIDLGDAAGAVQAALAAVETEPFRESAQRLLVRVYVMEGNLAAALRVYLTYRDLIDAELGIEPSDRMEELLAGLNRPARAQ